MSSGRTASWLLVVLAIIGGCTSLYGGDRDEHSERDDAGRVIGGIRAQGADDKLSGRGQRGSDSGAASQDAAREPSLDASAPAQDAASGSVQASDAAPAPDADAMMSMAPLVPDAAVEPPPPAQQEPPPPPMCLNATARCDETSQCCGGLRCGTTTLGRVCCGLQLEPCSHANGEDCCGALSCDRTTAGRVCCGERGAPCTFADGRDCCRDLECIGGHCG